MGTTAGITGEADGVATADVVGRAASLVDVDAFVVAGSITGGAIVAGGKTWFSGGVIGGGTGCTAGLSWVACVLSSGPCGEIDRHMKKSTAATTASAAS